MVGHQLFGANLLIRQIVKSYEKNQQKVLVTLIFKAAIYCDNSFEIVTVPECFEILRPIVVSVNFSDSVPEDKIDFSACVGYREPG